MKSYIQTYNHKGASKVCYRLKKSLSDQLYFYIEPLLEALNAQLYVSLVRTFYQVLECILKARHNKYGLLLTELGSHLLGPAHAPAGTKRISNLLRSPNWSYEQIKAFLADKAQEHLQQFEMCKGELPLLLWDDSVLEKPESIALESLSPVRSSKHYRLIRIKKGYYDPPTKKPAFVPGFQWCGLVLAGLGIAPCVFDFTMWSRKGKHAKDRLRVHIELLMKAAETFGDAVVHVFDRGFASALWVGILLGHQLRFIIRWRGDYNLAGTDGSIRKTYLWSVGRKAMAHRKTWDAVRGNITRRSFLWMPVRHPKQPEQKLWLIICRAKKGRKPWYLLTTEPVENARQAWKIIRAYARRWQIEMAFRFNKSELAMESPRLWFEHNRQKLFMMLTLVYSFMLLVMSNMNVAILLRIGCHRTGKRCRQSSTPLYRLRAAITYLLSLPEQDSG